MLTPTRGPFEIALAGMRFHVRIGTLPHERELAQPLEVDLRVSGETHGSPFLDYRILYALVASAIGTEPRDHLEDLAREVVAGALRVDGVTRARVAVRKPHVMLEGPVAYAEVVQEGWHG